MFSRVRGGEREGGEEEEEEEGKEKVRAEIDG